MSNRRLTGFVQLASELWRSGPPLEEVLEWFISATDLEWTVGQLERAIGAERVRAARAKR